MEARSLTRLVEVVLQRSWRRDSPRHGEEHWRCVATTGLVLADSAPSSDRARSFSASAPARHAPGERGGGSASRAPRRGVRARALGREGVGFDDERFHVRAEALRLRSDGLVSGDAMIGACWDADRLHLPRASIQPDPQRFSTRSARGEARLAAAAVLRRDGPPSWEELVALAVTAQ